MSKEKNKIKIKYNGKVYEIEKKQVEQKILPRGEIKPLDNSKHPEEITVRNYQENFWSTTAEINSNKFEIEWGNGKRLTIIGIPALISATIVAIAYFYLMKNNKKKRD